MVEILQRIDVSVFYFINNTCKNPVCDLLMPWVTELGGGLFIFGLAVIMLFIGKKDIKALGILLFAGNTVSYSVVKGIKSLAARPRPFMTLSDVNLLTKTGAHSFPSGHTTLAFLVAFLLTRRFKKLWYVFYVYALAIMISRVYLGVHYPSDVLAGAVLGTFLGYVLVRAAESADIIKK